MKAKMYLCNLLTCVMAFTGSFCFIDAIFAEEWIPDIFLGSFCTVQASIYHLIGKYA